MKAKPKKLIRGSGYVECEPTEATHLSIKMPGPTGAVTLPVMIGGTRAGTPNWTWNGDMEKPTLKPSFLQTSGHFIEGHSGKCWCDYNREHPEDAIKFNCYRCHTWITDGQVQFLPDSSHELAGQTLDLLEVEAEET